VLDDECFGRRLASPRGCLAGGEVSGDVVRADGEGPLGGAACGGPECPAVSDGLGGGRVDGDGATARRVSGGLARSGACNPVAGPPGADGGKISHGVSVRWQVRANGRAGQWALCLPAVRRDGARLTMLPFRWCLRAGLRRLTLMGLLRTSMQCARWRAA